MAPPIVEHTVDATVFVSSLISAGNLFSATDPDDAIVSYTFEDFRAGAGTGYFENNGVAYENGATFTIPASELANISYRGGSLIFYEGFRVIARDQSGNFSNPFERGRIYSVRSNTSTPHVKAPFITALANEFVPGSEFVRGFDPDGYPLTHFRISEANKVLKLVAANNFLTVTAFDHRFRTGDIVTITGSDQAAYNRTAPIVVLNSHTFRIATAGVPNGTGTGAIEAYSKDGGYFEVDGVAKPQGQTFTITADQVATLKYYTFGASNDENIYVQGFDGVDWSYNKRGIATTVVNANRPVVQFGNVTTPADRLMPIKGTFPVTDADQNTMKYYWFYNTSPHAHKGDLIFNGAIMPRQKWFLVREEHLDLLFFKTNLVGDEQQIRIRAFDGKHLSVPGTLIIKSTPPIVRPEIAVDQPVLVSEQLVSVELAPLFSQIDPGPDHTRVQVFEPTTDPNSGTLRFVETPLAGGQVHEFSKFDFDNRVNFYTGDFYGRNLDTVYVREQNLTGLWSSWEKIDIRTEPEFEDVLTSGTSWNGLMPINSAGKLEISYSFMQSFPLPPYETGEAVDGDPAMLMHFEIFNEAQRANARLAFRHIEEFANVQLVEVSDSSTNVFGQIGGIIRMGEYGIPFPQSGAAAYAFYPGFGESPGDMWFNRLNFLGGPFGPELDFEKGTWGFKVFLHEFGHAMGLKHPHDGIPRLPPETDVNDFSVMSYRQATNGGEPTTFQLYDVNELQDLYGANMATRTGNDGYSLYNYWDGNMTVSETIWDAGGDNDTLSAHGAPRPAVVDLRSGQQSSIGAIRDNITIAFGADIENALGSGFNDSLYGNGLNNMIQGRLGDDYLLGNAGNDYLIGAEGDDIFEWGVGDDNDIINEQGGGGTDTIRITDFPTVDILEEDFKFRLKGGDLYVDLHIDGGALDNTIRVINQLSNGNRVETLELKGMDIDLVNLTNQISATTDTFKLTNNTTSFGFIVAPA